MPKKTERELHERGEDEADELTPQELAHFKARLLEERAQVKQRLARHMSEAMPDEERFPDEMDLAGKISDQAYLMRLADKERKLLSQIEQALQKFEHGEYGYCEGTGELISRKRLELRPWTRYSIEHKEQLERQRGRRRRS